jgi:hypothetical protein
MMWEATEILEHIDSCQSELPFLSNDGRMHLTDARLSVFRSDTDWAVFVEVPHYCDHSMEFTNWVGGTGNCLRAGDWVWPDALNTRPLLAEAPDVPLWKYGVRHEPWKSWLADRDVFSVMVKNWRFDFAPTEDEYAAAGIYFDNFRSGAGSLEPGYLLRFLCHHLRHPFFAAERELRHLMRNGHEMELFIQTHHWQHPTFLVDPWDNDALLAGHHIRELEGFQILSRAIAWGDRYEWDNQDPERFTTNWESLESLRYEVL